MQLRYVIKFVSDMDQAVAFHRDALGLSLKFVTPEWTEFDTGPTTLALHPQAEGYPAGSCELAFAHEDGADALYAEREARGIKFIMEPTDLPGRRIARFLDSDGAETSVGG
jgi:predicted enzyme related to lactoylglutathione lyase